MAANNKPFTLSDLENLILGYMPGTTQLTPGITKQISKFVLTYEMTYLEIARCVCYYVEVLDQEIKPLYGIGSILNIREEAAAYFKKLELDQQKQKEAAQKVVEYQDNNIIFNIKKLPHKKRQPKQFDIEEVIITNDEKEGV